MGEQVRRGATGRERTRVRTARLSTAVARRARTPRTPRLARTLARTHARPARARHKPITPRDAQAHAARARKRDCGVGNGLARTGTEEHYPAARVVVETEPRAVASGCWLRDKVCTTEPK